MKTSKPKGESYMLERKLLANLCVIIRRFLCYVEICPDKEGILRNTW